jgi:hypothetical protein
MDSNRTYKRIPTGVLLLVLVVICGTRWHQAFGGASSTISLDAVISAHRAERIAEITSYHVSGVRLNFAPGRRLSEKHFSVWVMGRMVRRDLQFGGQTLTELTDSHGALHSVLWSSGPSGLRAILTPAVGRRKAFLASAETATLLFFLSRLAEPGVTVLSAEPVTDLIHRLDVRTNSSVWAVFVDNADGLIRRIVVGDSAPAVTFEFDGFKSVGEGRYVLPRFERVSVNGSVAFEYVIESIELRPRLSPGIFDPDALNNV